MRPKQCGVSDSMHRTARALKYSVPGAQRSIEGCLGFNYAAAHIWHVVICATHMEVIWQECIVVPGYHRATVSRIITE